MAEVSNEEKRDFIKKRLSDDGASADFQLSLLLAALNSYRFDSVLRPFPPMFLSESQESKDYKALEKVTEKMPPLRKLRQSSLGDVDLDLLYWILNSKNFSLHSCSKEKYIAIQKLTGQQAEAPQPTHIFEVVMSPPAEKKFEEKKADKKSFYAYHGSRLENFHSILHYGLQSHLNKNSLFGEGTYLSSELSVSMPYAPTGKSWDKSSLGDRMSVIAVAEIIDDPSVKCQVKDAEASNSPSRARAANSLGGDVPEKYYVVQNNDMMRIKYFVVFAETSKVRGPVQPSWMYRHRFVLVMLGYMLLLIVVGLYNSRAFRYQIKRWLR